MVDEMLLISLGNFSGLFFILLIKSTMLAAL